MSGLLKRETSLELPSLLPISGIMLDNGNFEEGIKNYNIYKDAYLTYPEDGIGGSPLYVSLKSSNINPLIGLNSGIITKANGDARGEGISKDFTIDRGLVNDTMKIEFVYETSDNYSDSIEVFLYDKTNLGFLPLSTQTIQSTYNKTGKFIAIFNPSTSNDYRIIFHVVSNTISEWTVNIDDIVIGNKDTLSGTAISEWQSYTPALSGFTTSSSNVKWRRVGSNMEIMGQLTIATVTNYMTVYFPEGYTNKIYNEGNTLQAVGTCTALDVGSTFYSGGVYAYTENTIRFLKDAGGTAYTTAVPFTWVAGDILSFQVSIPISQWSSNINLITDFTEYAYNYSTTTTSDTTSFGYGPEGAFFQAFTPSGISSITKLCKFKNPIKPTDKITLEFGREIDGVWVWTDMSYNNSFGGAYYRNDAGTTAYGVLGGISSTYGLNSYTISFYSSATVGIPWSAIANLYKWRVRKTSNGNMAESNRSGIYDSGSNANGYWIRYVDGTMECWTSYMQLGISPVPLNTTNATTWTFPQPFAESPVVNYSPVTNNSGNKSDMGNLVQNGLYLGALSSTYTVISVYAYDVATTTTVYINARAIGKWNNGLQVYAPGALVGITIEDSGSNSNGRYIKYSDGTLICYDEGTVTDWSCTNVYGSLYQGTRTFTFAYEFIENPAVSMTGPKWGTSASWGSVSTIYPTSVNFRMIDVDSLPAGTSTVYSYIAIGRWKL